MHGGLSTSESYKCMPSMLSVRLPVLDHMTRMTKILHVVKLLAKSACKELVS